MDYSKAVQTAREKIPESVSSHEILSQVLEDFLEDIPVLLEKIDLSLEEGDLKGVEGAAHQLKGISGTFGLHDLSAVSGELEWACRESEECESVREKKLALFAELGLT
ncbi:MAG: Hpt domain-containing protein [Planctomycetota bacterium]|nr:Hpt domain-containing protein [Planctomycetota bacterium]